MVVLLGITVVLLATIILLGQPSLRRHLRLRQIAESEHLGILMSDLEDTVREMRKVLNDERQ